VPLIPLTDATRRPVQFPLVTACLVVANVAVFLLELQGGDSFVLRWSVVSSELLAGHRPVTLVTSMFMHGGWLHLIGNMVFLWAFGPEVEDAMGSPRFLIFYFAGGIVAMLAQVLAAPHSTAACLGASGAIAAVMGAFLVTFPADRIKSVLLIGVFAKVTFIPAALLIGIWFVLQLFNLGAVADVGTGGVAYMAHIAGLLFGAATARLIEPGGIMARP